MGRIPLTRGLLLAASMCALALLPAHAAAQGCPECDEYTLDIPDPKGGNGDRGGDPGGNDTAAQDTQAEDAPEPVAPAPAPATGEGTDAAGGPARVKAPDRKRRRSGERTQSGPAQRQGAGAAQSEPTPIVSRPLAYESPGAGSALREGLGLGGAALLLLALVATVAVVARGRRRGAE